jgi:hypothetical protein
MGLRKITGQWLRGTLMSAWAICLLTPSVLCAQSFNLDFGTSFTALPTNFGAAAAQTGTWVDVPTGTSNTLSDIDGTATGVTIVAGGRGDTFNPQTTLESRLLRDTILADPFGSGDFEVDFSGLQDGDYTVYYYSGASATTGLTINGAAVSDLPGIGSADTIDAQGTNWNAVNVIVTGGALSLFSNIDGSGLAGLQLVYRQDPVAMAVPTFPVWALTGTMLAVLMLGFYVLHQRDHKLFTGKIVCQPVGRIIVGNPA